MGGVRRTWKLCADRGGKQVIGWGSRARISKGRKVY